MLQLLDYKNARTELAADIEKKQKALSGLDTVIQVLDSEPGTNGLTVIRGGRKYTAQSLQRIKEANQKMWAECPRGCLTEDHKPKKHRKTHPHIRRMAASANHRKAA